MEGKVNQIFSHDMGLVEGFKSIMIMEAAGLNER